MRIELAGGGSRVIELPGRGSAGYVWEFTIESGADSVALKTLEGSVPAGVTPPASFARTARFEVQALQPGHARVRFRLRRPWERQPLGGEDVVVDVEVRP